jgi:hypothetical protein
LTVWSVSLPIFYASVACSRSWSAMAITRSITRSVML